MRHVNDPITTTKTRATMAAHRRYLCTTFAPSAIHEEHSAPEINKYVVGAYCNIAIFFSKDNTRPAHRMPISAPSTARLCGKGRPTGSTNWSANIRLDYAQVAVDEQYERS